MRINRVPNDPGQTYIDGPHKSDSHLFNWVRPGYWMVICVRGIAFMFSWKRRTNDNILDDL